MKKQTLNTKTAIHRDEEQQLIILAKCGDMEAFNQLIHLNLDRVYALALSLSRNKYNAEEITQEVFLKAIKNIHSFRADSSIGTWLYRITVNTYINSKKSRSFLPLEDYLENENAERVIDRNANVFRNESRYPVDILLKHLSEKERSVFVLRHFENVPTKEIAVILGVSYGTIRTLLYRAVSKLRRELSNSEASRNFSRRKK